MKKQAENNQARFLSIKNTLCIELCISEPRPCSNDVLTVRGRCDRRSVLRLQLLPDELDTRVLETFALAAHYVAASHWHADDKGHHANYKMMTLRFLFLVYHGVLFWHF